MNMVTLANFVFASHSRRTQGVISSVRQITSVSARRDLKVSYRARISRTHHLLVLRFPFAFQLQHCMKSYGRGDENSYKNDEKPSCSTHVSLHIKHPVDAHLIAENTFLRSDIRFPGIVSRTASGKYESWHWKSELVPSRPNTRTR